MTTRKGRQLEILTKYKYIFDVFSNHRLSGGHVVITKFEISKFSNNYADDLAIVTFGVDYKIHFNKKEIGSYGLVGLSMGSKGYIDGNYDNKWVHDSRGMSCHFGAGYDFNKHVGVQLCCNVNNCARQIVPVLVLGSTINFTF